MSTIRQIIARVDDVKINAFNEETKTAWIAELDGKIALDVMLMSIEDAQRLQYAYPTDLESEPMVKFPHDSLYDLWLGAKIDFANGEYNKYQNSMEMFNAHYGNYVRWFAQFYEPAQGYGNSCRHCSNPPYYISAYALAVSRGFEGTLDQWLASLVGKKVAIRYEGDKVLWRWIREGEEDQEEGEPWTELIDVEALQKSKPVKGVDYFTEEDIESLAEYYVPVGKQDFGEGNTFGLKGYYFTGIDFASKKITLSMKQNEENTEGMNLTWVAGDAISVKNGDYYRLGVIKSVDGNVITLDDFPFSSVFTPTGAWDYDEHCVVSPNKPLSGQIEFGQYSAAFGYGNKIHAKGSVAMGANNTIGASAGSSFALGKQNTVNGSSAAATGYQNTASGDDSFATGTGTTASGQASMASGYHAEAAGKYSRASGNESKATGQSADASGNVTTASGDFSHATGNRTKATATGSAAHNYNTTASGENSFAIGSTTTASGKKAFSSGTSTTASGENSATFGQGTTASGQRAVALGFSSVASGGQAFAGGNSCEASGESSFAIGYKARAKNAYSNALGYLVESVYNSPTMKSQTVVGQYNAGEGTADEQAVFVIGCGTSSDNKDTAARVMESGSLDMVSHKITNVAKGTANADAVNLGQLKTYVNSITAEDVGAATEIHQHSNYASRTWVTEQIEEAQLGGSEVDLSGYAKVEDIPSLDGYATESFVTDKIAEAQLGSGESGDVDVSDFVTDDELSAAVEEALAQAKESGEFDGADGVSVTHEWDDTVLYITSASGTSGYDLQGAAGKDGVGIVSASINGDGELELTLSNGSVAVAGRVVGEDGKDGTGGISREFNSGEISTSSYTYTGGYISKIYHVYVVYTFGSMQFDDVFSMDWTMLPVTGYYELARLCGTDSTYLLKVSKDSSGHPVFESSNCTITRVIGYY